MILDLSQVADKSGLYIFAIRDDNHIEYSFRHLHKGEALYDGDNTDPTDWFVPIAYHFCNEYHGEMEWRHIITENSWYLSDSDRQTPGLRIIAYLRNEKLSYCLNDSYWHFSSEESVDIHDGWLWSYVDEYDDNLIKINPIAYHYVEFFGEEGHSYWWKTYRELHKLE